MRYLFYRYILRHEYAIGVDIGSQDDDCSVIVRKDKKGIRHVEKLITKSKAKPETYIIVVKPEWVNPDNYVAKAYKNRLLKWLGMAHVVAFANGGVEPRRRAVVGVKMKILDQRDKRRADKQAQEQIYTIKSNDG